MEPIHTELHQIHTSPLLISLVPYGMCPFSYNTPVQLRTLPNTFQGPGSVASKEANRQVARANIKTFIDKGVKRVLVASPHCYHTFKNEYPEFLVHLDVVHISQFLQELIEQGRLAISGKFEKKVTFHDPCYLGRHNGIYDQPRDVLRMLPGLELVEMPDTRERSLCCGGGGGRIWAETTKEERFSDLRVAQAVEVGAEVLATSCPYCISNFEESALSLEGEQKLAIKDITEVLFDALSENGGAA